MIRFIRYAEGSCRLSGCDLMLFDLLIKYQKIQPNASEIFRALANQFHVIPAQMILESGQDPNMIVNKSPASR